MSWADTPSLSFTARHEAGQADDALAVLESLESHRQQLEELFPRVPGNVTVVLEGFPLFAPEIAVRPPSPLSLKVEVSFRSKCTRV